MVNQFEQLRNSEGQIEIDGHAWEDDSLFVIKHIFGWCGCGRPEDAAVTILRALEYVAERCELMHGDDNDKWIKKADVLRKKWQPDEGIECVLLYVLDAAELTEHGGSVGGSWLSKKGCDVLDLLKRWENATT